MTFRRQEIIRTLGSVSTVQAVSMIVALLTTVVIARWLEPAGRGMFILALLIVQTVTLLLDLGLPGATMTFLLRREYPASAVINNSFFLAVARGALSLIITAGIWLAWSKFRALGLSGLLLVNGICVTDLLLLLLKNVLFGQGHLRRWAVLEIGVGTTFMVLISSSWLSGIGGSAGFALALYFAVRLAGLILAALDCRIRSLFQLKFDPPVFQALIKFGFRNMLNNITWALGPRVDLYVVSAWLTPAALGIYSLATGIVDKLLGLMYSIPTGLYRFQARSTSQNGSLEQLTARGLRISMVLGSVLVLSVVLTAGFLIPVLFGGAYAGAVKPLVILAPSLVFAIGFHIFGGYVTGYLLKPEVRAGFGLLLVLLNIGFNLLLVPLWGMTGAALATLTSSVLVFLLFAWYFIRTTDATLKQLTIPSREDIRAISTLVWQLFSRIWFRPASASL